MMEEAMGKRPRREGHQIEMEAHELKEVLRRGQIEDEQHEFYNNADRVEGLGFAPTLKTEDMAGIEVDENNPSSRVMREALGDDIAGALEGEVEIEGTAEGDAAPAV